MRKLDPDTLLYVCEVLYTEGLGEGEYRKGGQYIVYDLANSIDKAECGDYTIHWSYCEPCDNKTPHLPDQDECLVCGSVYEEGEHGNIS